MCPREITAIANPPERGTVAGGGTFEGGQTCTVTATANEGYVFFNWSENGIIVSTDATYSFIVAGNRNLIASFGLEGNITFTDANVKALCVANWDSNNDGELSYAEAATVGNLSTVFTNNNSITSFDELQHFTGLTSIGSFAFDGCSGLTSVTIPNSVTSIGDCAFRSCSSLSSVTIPNSVTSIGDLAFYGCNGLTSAIIGEGVTSIGYDAFYNCSGLTSVTIGNSVTSIGNSAFSYCSGLTSVTIPNSVTSIGSYAFSHCTDLSSVTIPNSVTSIGDFAFSICSSMTSVTIPNSVSLIGNFVFSGCSGLTSVTIPNSVTSIGDDAFTACSSLTSVIIPNSVTSIGISTFSGCSSLTSVTIPNSVTTIGDYAFAGCSGLTSVTIPNSVTSIGNHMFSYCSSLTSVTIPNSVTSIGDDAFTACSGLTSVTIGNSVTSIGDDAFSGCSGLSSIYCYASTPPTLGISVFLDVTLVDVAVYVPCATSWAYTNFGWGNFSNFIGMCPREITAIANPPERGTVAGGGTFEGGQTCTVTATANEGYVFFNWSVNGTVVSTDATYSFIVAGDRNLIASFGLEGNITFADANVKALCVANWDSNNDGELSYAEAATVGDLGTVFRNNSTITSFDELQHFIVLISIGNNAFENCTALTSVAIPNSVTSIGNNAFWNCPALQTVRFNAVNCTRMQTTYNNSIYSVFSSDEYGAAPALTRLTIGNDVKRIPDYAFYGAQGLYQRLTIPASVTEIGSYAFYGCSSIPLMANQSTSLQSIGEYAFYGCSSMRWTISLPGSLSSIGQYAFYNCNKLNGSLTIPNGVTSIGDYTFYGCSGLTGQLNLHSGITSIGSHAFEGAGLTGALVIPNAVTAINANTFAGCSGLSGTLVVGRQINSIGENAFQNCSGFTTLISENPDTPVAQANSFEGMNYNIPVHVPFNTVQNYQNATGWSNFFNYVEQFVFEMYDNDNWSDDWNWYTGELPGPDDVVCINSNCHLDMDANVLHLYVNNINDALTIDNGKTLTVTSGIGTQQASQLVVAEGGQLFNYFDNAYGTVQRNINGYGTSDDGWYTIAAPFVNGMPVSTITTGNYDLYYYDEPTAYWMNEKQTDNNFTKLNPAQGYLYANQNALTLALTGQLNPSNAQFSVPVTCIGSELAGFNLVGNPYTNNISITDVKINGTSQTAFYRAEGGNSLLAYVATDNEPIKPGEGFMVKTTANGTLTFNNNRSRNEGNNDAYVRLVMSKGGSSASPEAVVVDRAYLRINEGERLEKISTSNARSQLYFKNGSNRYAVANNEAIEGATPLYLEKASGTYTLEAALLNAKCDYLHLIDHLTSANIDLLKTPTYTFTAKPSDYEARFELVFDKNWNGATAGSESFAYYNGSAWVIANEGPATLQVVDMMGRVLSTETFCGNVETNIDAAPGVYVFRLINGDKVKVQKIVVRR